MRIRVLLLAVASTIAVVVPVAPARATLAAAVTFPNGDSTFYSPFRGPANVAVTFEEDDPATVVRVRVRRPGRPAIDQQDTLVDPAVDTSPRTIAFAWPNIRVSAPTEYVVQVSSGGTPLTSASFTLLPPLVHEVTVAPTPFYPHTDNGYRDTTAIGYTLAADTSATVVTVFADDAFGRCCGASVVSVDRGALAAGRHAWRWDGRDDRGGLAPEGVYFAKVSATDTLGATAISAARKIRLEVGTVRLTDTRRMNGSAYSGTGPTRVTLRGGECHVTRFPPEAHASCFGATKEVVWRWSLPDGGRIEKASFVTERGTQPCKRSVEHSKRESRLRVEAARSSSICEVETARITYSYPTLG